MLILLDLTTLMSQVSLNEEVEKETEGNPFVSLDKNCKLTPSVKLEARESDQVVVSFLENPSLDDFSCNEVEEYFQKAFQSTIKASSSSPIHSQDLLNLVTSKFDLTTGTVEAACYSSLPPMKGLLNELVVAKLPSCFDVFGCERMNINDVKLIEAMMGMTRSRRKEKARDSGQGKAPVKPRV